MPMKVYNGFEGVLAAYPARSSFALFPCRTVHLKNFDCYCVTTIIIKCYCVTMEALWQKQQQNDKPTTAIIALWLAKAAKTDQYMGIYRIAHGTKSIS